jgi:hypothetical protein
MALYYGNVWNAQNFPFLSQLLFTSDSNSTSFSLYDQSLILNADNTINQTALAEYGTPMMTTSYASSVLTMNLALTATITHMLLWNMDDIKAGWEWAAPSKLRKWTRLETYKFWKNQDTPEELLARQLNDESLDPHYRLMLKNLYPEIPQWWWGAVFVISFVVGLGCLYAIKSTLPWWGFIVANILTLVLMLFFGAQMGLTGFQFNPEVLCQTLAGYMFPGKPLASELGTFLSIYA